MNVQFTDHSKEVKAEFEAACLRALEKCGLVAEGYAKKLCPVDTGLLRNSITHALAGESAAISEYEANRPKKAGGEKKKGKYSGTAPADSGGEMSVYIGSNVEYAVHQEMGSGKHYPGGRKDPWTYTDEKGQAHLTGGSRAQSFLKPAIADHSSTYRKIINEELKGTGGKVSSIGER